MNGSEQKLSDAFTEMVLSGRSPDPASAQPSVAQSGACSIDAEEATVSSGETAREATTPARAETLAGEVNGMLGNLRSTLSSGDLNGAIEPLVSIMGKLMEMIPPSAHHRLPAAALPDFSGNRSRSEDAEPGSRPALYDVRERSAARFKDIADYATRAFRTMDTAQECLQDPSCLSDPSPPPPGTSSPTPSAAALDGLSMVGSMMNKLSDSFGSDWISKEASRIMQGNEAYLRASGRELALSLQSTPESDPQYPLLQSAFALVLLHLYEITRDSMHLDAAVDAASRAMATVVAERNIFRPQATFLVRSWAYSQRLSSRREGSVDPLVRAIDVAAMVLRMSYDYHPSDLAGRRLLSMELAECLLERYRHVGDVKDLDGALNHIHAAFKDGELDDTHSLYVIGTLYLERYTRLGTLDDLDKALYRGMRLQDLDDQSPPSSTNALLTPHPDAAPSTHLLAMSFAQRFAVIMDSEELNKAVTHGRKAIQLCPLEHPHRALYLSDLASLLHQSFVADEDPSDLEECIEKARAALEAAGPGCYPYYPPQAVLGLALARLGGNKGEIEPIDEGIRHLTIARKNFSGGTHLESRIEQDLASALLLKFEHTNAKDDLDEALHYASSALQRAPADDRSRAGLAFQLGHMLSTRHSLWNIEGDLEHAVDILHDVSNGSGAAPTRLRAAMEWAKVVAPLGPAASLDALKVALGVLPLVTWSGHRMVVQYRTLISLSSDIGPWAAACAISCGQLQDAVSYLERGRNILWSQLLAFQGGSRKHRATNDAGGTSAATTEADALASYITHGIHGPSGMTQELRDELKRRNPQLHGVLENLLSLADELKRKAASLPVHRPENEQKMDEFKASIRSIYGDASLHGAARRWTSLQSTMEDLGRENENSFHPFEPDSPLAKLLAGGYVVLLNAHSTRCDALIIRRAMDTGIQVDHVPLPELSADTASQWAWSIQIGMYDLQEGAMGVRELENIILIPILQELWRAAALPVLTHLSISDAASPPTRIWWCLSGPLAFLPIHAAGPYEGAAPGVPELVVSSYVPTIQSLLNAYSGPKAPFSMLAVGQPDTPNMSSLPSVRKELATIERACARVSGDLATLVGPDAPVFGVAHALASHTWLHLSCHAYQDPDYPFNSAFYMHNGPLTLKTLTQLDLARVQFAFFSACLTSAGDARLPDECIHLAAGMQFAGVRSAVATLWSVDDRASAFVAEGVYGRLMKEGVTEPDAGEAARALHGVVLQRKVAGKAMVFWVPFIHVGV